jgi:hypothetical protein
MVEGQRSRRFDGRSVLRRLWFVLVLVLLVLFFRTLFTLEGDVSPRTDCATQART